MDLVVLVATAFWAMLPAYVPNNAAVLGGGGRPIDGGRVWGGSRLLGDGKTWRGTAVGIGAGIAVGLLLGIVREPVSGLLGTPLPAFSMGALVALPTGAMVGDVAASFLKRRTGRTRGTPFPGVDQLDFVVGALTLAALVDPSWFGTVFTVPVIAVVVVLTPVLHVVTNAIAYWLGLKDEPW
ncbi:MAG: CDP-2,3-bis-(O-geranylgeranyl)-sn-glycerol synthase [Halodesulfurarchaeum sp.]|nr:CDP-2,3-bis-(O-geranylgeranyl)-sn-glycerol synthase [Halodesulfurarchaeum sp.]